MRWPDQPSVYGPVWTLLFGGIARASGGSVAAGLVMTKALIAALSAVAVWGLAAAARARGEDPARAVTLFAWNPLVLASVPLSAHVDIAIAACALWALVADRRRRPLLAAVLLATAALVKPYAGLLLLVYLVALVRRRARTAAAGLGAALALATAAFAPFWEGVHTFDGLLRVAGRTSVSLGGGVQRTLAAIVPDATAAWIVASLGLAAIAGTIAWQVRRESFAADPWPAAAAVFAAYLLVTPWFLYWHVVGLLALAAVAAGTRLRNGAFWFSGTAMLTVSGGTALGTTFQTALRYGIPLAAALRRGGSPGPARRSGRPDPRGAGSGAPTGGPRDR